MLSVANSKEQKTAVDEGDVELIDHLRILWKWKWLIVSGTLIATLLAFAITSITPRTYKATVTLLATESKIPPPQAQGGGTSNAWISPETFEAILKSQSLAAETIHHFELDKTSSPMTSEKFRQTVLLVETLRATRLLALSAVLPDAKLAADVANFVSQRAVALNTALNQSDTIS